MTTTNFLWCLLVLTLQLQGIDGVAMSPSRFGSRRSIDPIDNTGRIQEFSDRTQHHQEEEEEARQKKHRSMESGPPRRRIDPFTITMSPMTGNLTYSEANTVRNTVEELLQTFFQTNYSWPDQQTSVTYVGLAQILSNVRTEDETGVEVTMNGMVYFDEASVYVPTETEILLIIEQQALTPTVLTDALLSSFPTLELAEVTANLNGTDTSVPTPAPSGTPPEAPTVIVGTEAPAELQPPIATTAPSSTPIVTPTVPTSSSSVVTDDTASTSSGSGSGNMGGLIGGIIAAIVIVMVVAVLFVRRHKASGTVLPNRTKTIEGQDEEVAFEVDEENRFDPQDWGWKPTSSPPGNFARNSPVVDVGSPASTATATTVSSSFGEIQIITNSSDDKHVGNVSPEKTVLTTGTKGERSTSLSNSEPNCVPSSNAIPPSPSGTSGTRSGTENQTAAATTKAGTVLAMSYWTSLFHRTPPSSPRHLPKGRLPDAMSEEIASVASSDLLKEEDDDEDFDIGTDFDDAISIQPHIVAINSVESFEHQRNRGDFIVKKDMLESPIVNTSPNPRRQVAVLPSNLTGIYTNTDGNGLGGSPNSSKPSYLPKNKKSSKETKGNANGDDGSSTESEESEKRQQAMIPNPYVHRRPYLTNDIMNLGVVDRSSSCLLEPTDMSAASLAQRQVRPTQQQQQQQGVANGSKSQNMIPKLGQGWWSHRSSSADAKTKNVNRTSTSFDGSLNQSDDYTFEGDVDDDAWDPDSEMSSLGTSPTEDDLHTLFQTKVENKKEHSLMNHSLRNESQKRQLHRLSQSDGQAHHSPSSSDVNQGHS